MIALPTRPEALEVALDRSAIIVVDMQNAFASRGGLLDLAGIDISGAAEVVRTVDAVLGAARTRGVQVVYLVGRPRKWRVPGCRTPAFFEMTRPTVV